MTRDRLPPQPLLLMLTLLLAASSGSALTRCPGCGSGVQTSCRGSCVEEEDAGSPAESCAEAAGGCLRREGQPCGVYIPKCAPGLQCQPRENEEAPLRALLMGHGRCHRARGPSEETTKESKPHGGTSRQRDTSHRDRQKNPGTSTTPIRPNPGGVHDTEMGPCRRHLDSVLQSLQTEIFRGGAHGLYMPNCDLRGFYRKQQCRSSQGNRRGPCWCVDPLGRPLPASPDGHGSSQCSAKSSG
ncbi:insulin-like growth factor-binding protein 6 [Phodopus roborovskii]|uniref:Insulin-like growth factor-binding protein 6 n=1 Tax=Phodopus roborovskii TaxID=109678 RepID=A0AAU9ZG05_PHORO|nr:insulin-like growth factor-binding protein 6 [Phodopus roborovskii]CAH6791534.1 Igfbp6 [Phodopus roborovskii]